MGLHLANIQHVLRDTTWGVRADGDICISESSINIEMLISSGATVMMLTLRVWAHVSLNSPAGANVITVEHWSGKS